MRITTEVDNDNQLTTHTVIREVTFEDALTTLNQFWEGHQTKNVLWDLRKAVVADFSSKEAKIVSNYIKNHLEKRPEGKTAMVVSGDLEYGLSRMVQTLGEIRGLSLQIGVFRSFKEATLWLEEE
jgi:hypothetical protein